RGAQQLAAEMGWTLEAAVLGANPTDIANEIAKTKVAKVYALACTACEHYTPDAYAAALKKFLEDKKPTLVLMPHTYQVRDFAPKLVTSMQKALIPDAVGFKHEGGKLMFTRQMFQGKFVADVSFAGEAPWFATFQNGAFRGDKAEAGAAAASIEDVTLGIADARTKPHAWVNEAK